jgi:hypothetical protein
MKNLIRSFVSSSILALSKSFNLPDPDPDSHNYFKYNGVEYSRAFAQ